jgi:hypothetical protein
MTQAGEPRILTEAQILENKAKTSCLIRQVADKAELGHGPFRNNMTETLFIGPDLMLRHSNRMLTYSTDPSLDNKLLVKIGTELYLLVMERAGDQIDIEGGILGVGTKLRLEPGKWTSLFGAQYRGGGVTINNQGLEPLEGTVKRGEGAAPENEPAQGKTPSELEALLRTHPEMAESILPTLEQAILQEIRNKGADDRFFIKEFTPKSGPPGSMTLVQAGKGALGVETEFPSDRLPVANNWPTPFGNLSINRFKGRVELDIGGAAYTFISEDSKFNRLTFAVVDGMGYVYLRGKGTVMPKDGKEVKLGD